MQVAPSSSRIGFGRSGRSRRPTNADTESLVEQYSEPLVSQDLEVARGPMNTTAQPQDANSSVLDTSSSHQLSEYTVNTTMNTTQPPNTLLQDVAFSQEHMESALTVGTESLHDQTKSTLAQEWCWLTVLSLMIWYTTPADALGMAEKCGIDPREEIVSFLLWILAPVALARLVIFFTYRTPRTYQTFLSFSFALSVYYHGTFGFWTLENFVRMIQAPPACGKEPVTLLKLAYHVTLIVGAFPAIVFILGTVLFTCFIPYFFYERFQRAQHTRNLARKNTEMLAEMFKIKWNAKSLTYQDECCICLGEFNPKQSVVALPCDFKHYFHQGCIENWFKYHTACPFCKKDVTLEAIRQSKPDYERKIKELQA